ncbi:MAG: flagellar basal body protein FliL [Kibdelosporangium sp.]
MSWQEDLRKLDSELASGQISADEYRTRRDGLLSSAVTPDTPAPAAEPASQSETTQFIPPVGALPPQARLDQTTITPLAPPVDTPEKTQVVASADRTQAVRPSGDADRTQTVAPVAPPYQTYNTGQTQSPPQGFQRPAPPQGFQAQRPDQYGWNTPENDPQSPWGGQNLSGAPSWARQGPEVFDDVSTKASKKKPLVILAVIVLVAAIGAGGYFLFFRDKGTTEAGPGPQAPPPATVSERPKDDLEIAELPGNAGVKPEFQTFADLEKAGTLTAKENTVCKTAETGKVRLANASLPEGLNALVLTMETGSADNARTSAEELVKLQGIFGMKPYAGTAPTGVTVTQIEKTAGNPAAIRGHYVHGRTVVRVQAAGPDLAKITKAFDEILAAQLEALPADG